MNRIFFTENLFINFFNNNFKKKKKTYEDIGEKLIERTLKLFLPFSENTGQETFSMLFLEPYLIKLVHIVKIRFIFLNPSFYRANCCIPTIIFFLFVITGELILTFCPYCKRTYGFEVAVSFKYNADLYFESIFITATNLKTAC